ncbi:MAG: 3-dehydroquinate synthase [Anaerolineales bacterium]|nr:3-dehydroquinate synthase [Anaerolineales bacterium]
MIFLYGPPGSGKSTIGRLLAEALNRPFWDADAVIEAQAGIPIPQIFAQQGEAGFRAREAAAIAELLTQGDGVLALGGGALLNEAVRRQVEAAGSVVCLQAAPAVLLPRLANGDGERPLLAADLATKLPQLLAQRAAHYASFPLQIDASAAPDAVVYDIQVRLGLFHVRGMGDGYDVLVQPGGLAQLGQILRARQLRGPIALVSDENVAAHYLEKATAALQAADYVVQPVVIPPGETHKTMQTVAVLWEAFLQAGLERGSTIVALGGGVVGDLAGFAAATYLRGLPWVGVPTSLLAMVDSSLGGKTGADLPQGKNLVGAFHSPRLVLADPDVLATLPPAELRNGLGEVVKHGIIADPALFALCAEGWTAVSGNWPELVSRAMAVKIAIIQADPYEGGVRASLNLGHTIGHAVELVSGFQLRHGEAVAVGTVAEAQLAEQMGLAEAGVVAKITAVLRGLELPTEIPPALDWDAVIRAVNVDKKRKNGRVKFALPIRIGEVRVGIDVPDWPHLIQTQSIQNADI